MLINSLFILFVEEGGGRDVIINNICIDSYWWVWFWFEGSDTVMYWHFHMLCWLNTREPENLMWIIGPLKANIPVFSSAWFSFRATVCAYKLNNMRNAKMLSTELCLYIDIYTTDIPPIRRIRPNNHSICRCLMRSMVDDGCLIFRFHG